MLADIFGMDGVLVVIVIVAVLFGASAIPKLARNLGAARSEFEKGMKESAAAKETDGSSTHPPTGT